MGATLSADLKAWAAFCPGGTLADEDVGLPPPSVSPLRMSIDLQRKLGRGVNVNLKLLIRGDLQTGKTSMWRRLQGLSYVARVEPSSQGGEKMARKILGALPRALPRRSRSPARPRRR